MNPGRATPTPNRAFRPVCYGNGMARSVSSRL